MDKLIVTESRIAGKGAFAARDLEEGELLGEYYGEILNDEQADDRYEHEPMTYLFYVEDGHYVDALHSDCPLRFLNHSCDPNCHVEIKDKKVWFYTSRKITKGEELTIDYELYVDETDENPYTCYCGTTECRGTMKEVKTTSSGTSAQDL